MGFVVVIKQIDINARCAGRKVIRNSFDISFRFSCCNPKCLVIPDSPIQVTIYQFDFIPFHCCVFMGDCAPGLT